MATVCYAFRLTPDEYRRLTLEEHRAFLALLKEVGKGG